MWLEKLLVCSGSPLMLNGKLKSHFELWDALLQVEKMFDTMDDEVSIIAIFIFSCHMTFCMQVHSQVCNTCTL